MSDLMTPVAPLIAAAPEPVAEAPQPLIGIEPVGLRGMITIRGDLSSKTMKDAVAKTTGLKKLPGPLSVESNDDTRVVWMSPDELLVFCAYGDADATVARIDDLMGDAHHMAVNVSDTRAVLRLTGPRVGEVLAKGAPCDCSDHGFPVGTARRTHLAGLAVAFWRLEPEVWEIVAMRSYAHHLLAWVEQVSVPGSEVFPA